MTLLPPNATRLERALESATARTGNIAAPIDALLDPMTINVEWLPWLAWGLSLDSWDADWSEQVKRKAVAQSIALHRIKGTRQSIEAVLARFDQLLRVVEWHETTPRGVPHTFEIILPLAVGDTAPGGTRATAAFAEAIIREVTRVKPLREHMKLVQSITAAGAIGILGVARAAVSIREDANLTIDASIDWPFLLQTQDGEPITFGASEYLDTRP